MPLSGDVYLVGWRVTAIHRYVESNGNSPSVSQVPGTYKSGAVPGGLAKVVGDSVGAGCTVGVGATDAGGCTGECP